MLPSNRLVLVVPLALIATAAAENTAAHHSHSNYDVTHWIPLEGTVKEVNLINPHSWIYLEVASGGSEPTVWALEAAFPRWLLRNGIKPEDVQAGDAIKVRCHRLRDGGNGCLLGYVTPLHGDAARGHGVEKEWD